MRNAMVEAFAALPNSDKLPTAKKLDHLNNKPQTSSFMEWKETASVAPGQDPMLKDALNIRLKNSS